MLLNQRAHQFCNVLAAEAALLGLRVEAVGGCRVIDAGVETEGGVEAGRRLAEICLAGMGSVSLHACDAQLGGSAMIEVATNSPLWACMGSQYAGWGVSSKSYFGMGSGPMRLLAAREDLLAEYELAERAEVAVGVIESDQLPGPEVCELIAAECCVSIHGLTLVVARTNSHAGNLQVVARSVETALHKLHELGFDLRKIRHGSGRAPLPPLARKSLGSLARTNDAVLYGSHVTLEVDASDDELAALAPRVPSCASRDFGRPFAEIFDHYDRDFYRVDPLLFSPAQVTLVSSTTGHAVTCGELRPDVLAASFRSES